MRIGVEIDIAKEAHWATAIDADGVVHVDRKLLNTPADIAALVAELAALGSTIRVGLDVVGGIAGLAEAMLAEAGFTLVHVPGLAVNRARQGTVGGENKSDPRDARTIADQARTRTDLRPSSRPPNSTSRFACSSRRRDLVQAQTQPRAQLEDAIPPGQRSGPLPTRSVAVYVQGVRRDDVRHRLWSRTPSCGLLRRDIGRGGRRMGATGQASHTLVCPHARASPGRRRTGTSVRDRIASACQPHWPSAVRRQLSRFSASKGFVRKHATPARSARARTRSFGYAVIRTVGMRRPDAARRWCRSSPLIPGMLTSAMTEAARVSRGELEQRLPRGESLRLEAR